MLFGEVSTSNQRSLQNGLCLVQTWADRVQRQGLLEEIFDQLETDHVVAARQEQTPREPFLAEAS